MKKNPSKKRNQGKKSKGKVKGVEGDRSLTLFLIYLEAILLRVRNHIHGTPTVNRKL